jgi:hypothetical protein
MATRGNRGAPDRCRGCGKKIHADDRTVRVSLGQLHSIEDGNEDFQENSGAIWGYMHEQCFYLAVGDPKAIRMMVPITSPSAA